MGLFSFLFGTSTPKPNTPSAGVKYRRDELQTKLLDSYKAQHTGNLVSIELYRHLSEEGKVALSRFQEAQRAESKRIEKEIEDFKNLHGSF